MKKTWLLFTSFALMLTLSGCHLTGPMGTDNLSDLKNAHSTGKLQNDASGQIRFQALQDTAMSIGAQAGLAWRANKINQVLQDHSKELDQIFNFNRLMLSEHVLPPVLTTSEKNMKIDGVDTIRLSDQIYVIESQARFVTAAPNWRDYLWMNYKTPDMPPENMLPNSAAEQKIWQEYVVKGWQQGVQQAGLILQGNLARLTRDVKGMVLYRKLLAERMVSAPHVDQSNLGVTGGGSSLRINDQVLQITALPQLQPDQTKWHPVVVPQTDKTVGLTDE